MTITSFSMGQWPARVQQVVMRAAEGFGAKSEDVAS